MKEGAKNYSDATEARIKRRKRKGWKVFLLILFLAILLLLGVIFGSDMFLGERRMGGEGFEVLSNLKEGIIGHKEEEILDVEKEVDEESIESEEIKEGVIGEEGVLEQKKKAEEGEEEYYFEKEDEGGESEYVGEYNVRQISFGNSVVAWDRSIEGVSLEMRSIEVEKLDSMDDESASVLITWTTTKSTISELIYSKKDGSDAKKVSESNYGVSHGVFLNELDFSTEYIFNIKSTDKRGNTIESGYRNFKTSGENNSIINSIKETLKSFFE